MPFVDEPGHTIYEQGQDAQPCELCGQVHYEAGE